MSDLYLLETAVETLRGEIFAAAIRQTQPSGFSYAGHGADVYFMRGMSKSLAILEGVYYDFLQRDIETRLP